MELCGYTVVACWCLLLLAGCGVAGWFLHTDMEEVVWWWWCCWLPPPVVGWWLAGWFLHTLYLCCVLVLVWPSTACMYIRMLLLLSCDNLYTDIYPLVLDDDVCSGQSVGAAVRVSWWWL